MTNYPLITDLLISLHKKLFLLHFAEQRYKLINRLMAEKNLQKKITSIFRYRTVLRSPNALILASLVSGFAWYFTNQQVNYFNARQLQLIARVEKDEVAQNFKHSFDPTKVEDWECKKVNVDGVIKGGRFFVKRNRGKQEGYLVLAPFAVQAIHTDGFIRQAETYNSKLLLRKYIINLGWIPKTRKHLVYTTIPENLLGEEIYAQREDALKKQKEDGFVRDPLLPEVTVPITNVTAYIRKGEQEDTNNGRINFKDSYLYKWINLKELSRVFRAFNQSESETVYLERTLKGEEDPQIIPVAASKETVIADLNNQSKHFQNNAKKVFWLTTGLSFGVASWITFL